MTDYEKSRSKFAKMFFQVLFIGPGITLQVLLQAIKLSMLISAEQKIQTAHKYENSQNPKKFQIYTMIADHLYC